MGQTVTYVSTPYVSIQVQTSSHWVEGPDGQPIEVSHEVYVEVIEFILEAISQWVADPSAAEVMALADELLQALVDRGAVGAAELADPAFDPGPLLAADRGTVLAAFGVELGAPPLYAALDAQVVTVNPNLIALLPEDDLIAMGVLPESPGGPVEDEALPPLGPFVLPGGGAGSGVTMPPLGPAATEALAAYNAIPAEERTAADYDALVVALAMDEALATQAIYTERLETLSSDPAAMAALVQHAAEGVQLAEFVAAYQEAQQLFAQLQRDAVRDDPSWSTATVSDILGDPARFEAFMSAAARGMDAAGGIPGAISGRDPSFSLLRTAVEQIRSTVIPEGGVTYQQAFEGAQARMAVLAAEHPELLVLDARALVDAFAPGALDRAVMMSPAPGGAMPRTAVYVSAADIDPAAAARHLAPLEATLGEIQGVIDSLASAELTAADLGPVAYRAVELLTVQAAVDPSPESLEAMAFAVRRMEEIEAQQTRDAVLRVGLAVIGIVAGIAAGLATGGLGAAVLGSIARPVALALFSTSLAATGVDLGLAVSDYSRARNLSQYNLGEVLDLSGVEEPSEVLFGLTVAFGIFGIAADAFMIFRLAQGLGLLGAGDDAARALAQADDLALATRAGIDLPFIDEIMGARSYASLSDDAKNALAEFGIRSQDFYTSRGMAVSSDRMLHVFQQTHGSGRSFQEALSGGYITADDVVQWYSRGSSADDAASIVMSIGSRQQIFDRHSRLTTAVGRLNVDGVPITQLYGLSDEEADFARAIVAAFGVEAQTDNTFAIVKVIMDDYFARHPAMLQRMLDLGPGDPLVEAIRDMTIAVHPRLDPSRFSDDQVIALLNIAWRTPQSEIPSAFR